eukprot:Amastigsp_a1935_20.p1 type:complete len:489 gc:universal Amastigsp_a1935_20:1-1467(+)
MGRFLCKESRHHSHRPRSSAPARTAALCRRLARLISQIATMSSMRFRHGALVIALLALLCAWTPRGASCDDVEKPGSARFDLYIGVSAALILMAGMVSGLTMGLMSLDELNLTILQNSGKPHERVYASRIRPLVKRHHLLLVTLLICNAAAAEALPIFLDRVVHPVVAILISVTAVLIFGEILPQSVCTRYGLAIGAHLSPVVWFLIFVMFPIAWPISKVLDYLVGADHGTYYRKAELKELVNIHTTVKGPATTNGGQHLGDDEAAGHAHSGSTLTHDEAAIVKGALDLRDKTAAMILTPLHEVFMLDESRMLDVETMQEIIEDGHSRVPIFRKKRAHIIGMILIKRLILLRPEDRTPISQVELFQIPSVAADFSLYRLLELFLSSRSHMAVVLDPVDMLTVIGVVTLENVIEELIQDRIEDETDVALNTRRKMRVVEAFKNGASEEDDSSTFYRTDSNVQARPRSAVRLDSENSTYDESSRLLPARK